MTSSILPSVNATFNLISTALLALGYFAIKRGETENHKRYMVGALISSALFLVFYLIYHYQVGSVPYPHHDWTRPLYFAILIPHIILAALMVPFIAIIVYYAAKQDFEKHKRFARYVWPVWMYVSISGVLIYVMLYQL